MVSFRCFGGFVSVFRWFRSGVSVVSAVPVVSVVSFRWFRFGVSGVSTCRARAVRYACLLRHLVKHCRSDDNSLGEKMAKTPSKVTRFTR